MHPGAPTCSARCVFEGCQRLRVLRQRHMEGQPDPEERFRDEGAKRHLAEQSEARPTNKPRTVP